jgi:hypothetical protein
VAAVFNEASWTRVVKIPCRSEAYNHTRKLHFGPFAFSRLRFVFASEPRNSGAATAMSKEERKKKGERFLRESEHTFAVATVVDFAPSSLVRGVWIRWPELQR